MFSLIAGVSACQNTGVAKGDKLASGSLLSIGKEHLVLQGDSHVMFVSLDEGDKRQLSGSLKKGEKITLLGKKDVEEVSPGHSRTSAEVYEIVREDGTRIALNSH
ncbi:MAG: hypothetical protein K2Q01_10770 [Rickettsiales bacterium]|nr:hypothetical protein [Rickettsiales bacterium]